MPTARVSRGNPQPAIQRCSGPKLRAQRRDGVGSSLLCLFWKKGFDWGEQHGELVAAPLEEAVNRPAGREEPDFFLLIRRLCPSDMHLAPGDEVGRRASVRLARNRNTDPRAGKLVPKPRNEVGIARFEAGDEPLDRIDPFRRLVVAGPGRYEGKCELVHRKAPQNSGGRAARSTGCPGLASGITELARA